MKCPKCKTGTVNGFPTTVDDKYIYVCDRWECNYEELGEVWHEGSLRRIRRAKALRAAAAVAVLALALGCETFNPQDGGESEVARGTNVTRLKQSQNPKAPSRQTTDSQHEIEESWAPGSTIFEKLPTGETNRIIYLPFGGNRETKIRDRTETQIGAAQKDEGRELAARLAGMKPIMWGGVALVALGLASFTPWLRPIFGSVTTSLVFLAGGLALMVVPNIIAGNEILILCIVIGLVAAWFLAHRHGVLRGKVGE